MRDGDLFEIEVEPEEPTAVAVVAQQEASPLSQILPPDFPLRTLLTFLPDVRLKRKLETSAAEALAVPVENGGKDALAKADAKLTEVRDGIKDVTACFEDPCSLANQLHKRMTGLRADFLAAGERAVDVVGRRIYAETQRLRKLEEAEKRRIQDEADRQARESARVAAEAAKQQAAPAPVVAELERRAETAVAPPVQTPVLAPALAGSTVAPKLRGRLVGTAEDGEPRPKLAEMNAAQVASFRALAKAVGEGKADLSLIEMNWSEVDRAAKAAGVNLNVPGLESWDAGSVRAKGRR